MKQFRSDNRKGGASAAKRLALALILIVACALMTACYMEPDRVVDAGNALDNSGKQDFQTVITDTPAPTNTPTPAPTSSSGQQMDWSAWTFGDDNATNPPASSTDASGVTATSTPSGGTITVGRALGYTREAAVRLSFLMAIPAVFGSGLLEAIKAVKNYKTDAMFPGWGPTLVAMVISFVLGYIVIIGFLKFVSNFSYKAFAIYRIGLAVVVALLLIVGVLPAIDPSVVAAA